MSEIHRLEWALQKLSGEFRTLVEANRKVAEVKGTRLFLYSKNKENHFPGEKILILEGKEINGEIYFTYQERQYNPNDPARGDIYNLRDFDNAKIFATGEVPAHRASAFIVSKYHEYESERPKPKTMLNWITGWLDPNP